jgi:hypothetical protein
VIDFTVLSAFVFIPSVFTLFYSSVNKQNLPLKWVCVHSDDMVSPSLVFFPPC